MSQIRHECESSVSAVLLEFCHSCYVRGHMGKMDDCKVRDAFVMRHLLKNLIAIIYLFLNYHSPYGILECTWGSYVYLSIYATFSVSY